ncbi:MAG TPA: dihydropteroate synthase [Chloroflexota bacterium]|nr:dihydropteroate synthase [Chloroflexota bacterium]
MLRLDALAPAAAAALRAAADAVGVRAALGPQGALVAATREQHAALAARLAADPAHAALGQAIAATLVHQYGPPPPPTRLGATTWAWGQRTYVMGILNIASDSFSGDALPDVAAAVAQARAFAAAGADILDVGGESTRPGASPLPADQELARILPVIAALREAVPLPISVDTYKASVAAAALQAGACVVNDVTALRADPAIARVAAAHGAALILMHNRPAPVARGPLGGHNPEVAYADLLGEVLRELRAAVAQAKAAGVPPAQIWVDPGIGFGKTREQNLELLARLGELRALGRPILLGTSRKSVIGLTLGLPVDQRVEGTAATVALGIAAGADVVRVHDVRSMALVARLSDAIVRGAE